MFNESVCTFVLRFFPIRRFLAILDGYVAM